MEATTTMQEIGVKAGVCPRCGSRAALVAADRRGRPTLTCPSCSHRTLVKPQPVAPWWARD